MLIFGYKFRPGLIPVFLFVLLLPTFIGLGNWQLDRAEQKHRLYQDYINKLNSPAVNLQSVVKDEYKLDDILWRKVKFEGEFIAKMDILLDNKIKQAEAGYYVFKLVKLKKLDKNILVNFGWLSANKRRDRLPELKQISVDVMHSGIMKKPQYSGIKLSETEIETMSENVYRVQNIDFHQLETFFNLKIEPFVVRIDEDSIQGYLRTWSLPGSGKEKHYGYAFQWFSFAVILCFLFVYLNLKKDEQQHQ